MSVVMITFMVVCYFVLPTITAESLLEYLFFVLSAYVVWIARLNHKIWVNIVAIYIFLLFYFNGFSLLWDIVGILDIHEADWFSMNPISHEDNLRALLNLNISLLAISIGDTYFCMRKGRHAGFEYFEYRLPSFFLYFLMIIGFAVKGYYAIQKFNLLQEVSYHETFGEGGVEVPSWAVIIGMLPLYAIFTNIGKGGKIWYLFLFIYVVMSLSGGQRAHGMMLMLIIIYYLNYLKFIHLNFKIVGIIGTVFLALSIFIANFRNGSTEMISDASEIVAYIQGIPYGVLQKAVQFQDRIHYSFFDLFGNISSMFFASGNDPLYERAVVFKIWNGYISYVCNPDKYFAGFGMGGNFIGQLFAAGKEPLVLLFSIWGGYFLCYIEDAIFGRGSIRRFLFMNVAFTFLYISRDHLFAFCNTMVTPLLCGLIVQMTFWLVRLLKLKLVKVRMKVTT